MDDKIIEIIDRLEEKFDKALEESAFQKDQRDMMLHTGRGSGYSDSINEILLIFPHLRDKYPWA